MKNRKSEVLAFALVSGINKAIARLVDIWDNIGIQEEQRVERMEAVKKHIELLMNEMIIEEENLKLRILKNISACREELDILYHELSLEPYQIDQSQTVLQLEKDLRTKLENLVKEKTDRLKELKSLQEEEKSLCIDLCATPYYIPTGSIPSHQQLQDLKEHIKRLSLERESRVEVFSGLRQEISQLMNEIGHNPETTLEKDAVCDDADTFLLTSENIKALKLIVCQLEVKKETLISTRDNLMEKVSNLWNRLEFSQEEKNHFENNIKGSLSVEVRKLQNELDRLDELKRANMEEVIENIRHELMEYWDKCTFSTEQREAFAAFYSDDFKEELLIKHEEELARLKNYYAQCKVLFEAVNKWEHNWQLFQDFEKKASDPNRFSNRGGTLLRESKERAKIQKMLPKLEEEIKGYIEAWEAEQGTAFFVKGQRFMDYVANQWEELKTQKEKEKSQRLKKGDNSALRTPPVKRPHGGNSIMNTPSKTRKLTGTPNASVMRTTVSSTSSNSTGSNSIGSTFHSVTGKPPLSVQKTPHRSRLPDISHLTPLQEFKSDKPAASYTQFAVSSNKELEKKSNNIEAILNSTAKDVLH
ncbi:protein regulator of cytokinesis 1-like isoform X1 [Acipenser ruthenus]|uniref:protein regulator of cytokinesis 1-like isoform X1 n=1 Tax=Acipenser ruthenus TaxID=7906 RepID=UPI00145B4129|nr:protein regulator of cytokinesis 1-like isoform X1 [Acipenser ruthenus]